jgi:hypothetical protein
MRSTRERSLCSRSFDIRRRRGSWVRKRTERRSQPSRRRRRRLRRLRRYPLRSHHCRELSPHSCCRR